MGHRGEIVSLTIFSLPNIEQDGASKRRRRGRTKCGRAADRTLWRRKCSIGLVEQKRPLHGAVWCASASRHFSTHRSTPVRTGNCTSSRQDVVSFPGHTSKGEGVEIRRTTVSIMKCAVNRAFRDGEGALSFTTFYKPPNSVPPKPPMISAPSGDRHQVAFSRAYEPVAL